MTQDIAPEERGAQKSYWIEHSAEPTVEAMMLDSKAADIDKMERPEVCLAANSGIRGHTATGRQHPLVTYPAPPSPLALQVLKLLGSIEGLRIVELGAGIGR